jgi:hypothetical protein
VLDGLSARYDTTAGDITLLVHFFEPLAEPGALGGFDLSIYLADNVGTDDAPVCLTLLSPHNLLFTLLLGSDLGARAFQYGGPTYRFRATVSPDRRTVRIRGALPAFANLGLMCAHADLSGPNGEYSFIGAQLFSGFGPLDGNLVTTGRWALADEVAKLNNRLGRARRDPPLGRWPSCSRTGRAQLQCGTRSRLRDVRGRPEITVNGRMTVSYTRSLRTRWRRDMRATLRWRRCPRSVNEKRAGRRCAVRRRWRGGQLSRVFRSVLRGAGRSEPGAPPGAVSRFHSALPDLLD